jgi:hypothetical protein
MFLHSHHHPIAASTSPLLSTYHRENGPTPRVALSIAGRRRQQAFVSRIIPRLVGPMIQFIKSKAFQRYNAREGAKRQFLLRRISLLKNECWGVGSWAVAVEFGSVQDSVGGGPTRWTFLIKTN